MFWENDVRIERARAKRRMYEKEERILFDLVASFFKGIPAALFGRSKTSSKKLKKITKKQQKQSSKTVQSASLANIPSIPNNSSTRKALLLLAITGAAAASTYIIAKKVYK